MHMYLLCYRFCSLTKFISIELRRSSLVKMHSIFFFCESKTLWYFGTTVHIEGVKNKYRCRCELHTFVLDSNFLVGLLLYLVGG